MNEDRIRPLIGITPQYNKENNTTWMREQYTGAILRAGGVPVILEQFTDAVALDTLCGALDGILFTGGADIHPSRYGEDVLPECGAITEVRDAFEFALYPKVLSHRLPVLGICRGVQFLNVAEGGTLYQHISGHTDGIRHSVSVSENSLLSRASDGKTALCVNSYHHQAVKDTAPTCIPVAYAGDGTVEAIEKNEGGFWLGVQWHPEILYTEDDAAFALFCAFVDACRDYRAEK